VMAGAVTVMAAAGMGRAGRHGQRDRGHCGRRYRCTGEPGASGQITAPFSVKEFGSPCSMAALNGAGDPRVPG
jgi:hypothetical protein